MFIRGLKKSLFRIVVKKTLTVSSSIAPGTSDLIIHGSAHRGANGVAMPTDEDDQDGHFF